MARDMLSLGKEVGLFHSESEDLAGKVFERIDAIRARRDAALKRTHAGLDAEDRALADVEKFAASLEQVNGGPPLDDSPKGSPQATPPASTQEVPQPQASWRGDGGAKS